MADFAPTPRRLGSPWWCLVPFLTVGLATFACVLAAGAQLKDRWTQFWGLLYFAVVVGLCVGLDQTDPDVIGPIDGALAAGVLISWLGGTAHVFLLHRRMAPAQPVPAGHGLTPLAEDPTVVAVQQRLSRREEAKDLVHANPVLAAELKIGRPDLPGRTFDDGGLVDVNHVPPGVLVGELSLPRELADEIVEQRDRRAGFATAEELLVYCARMTPDMLERVRGRLVFGPM